MSDLPVRTVAEDLALAHRLVVEIGYVSPGSEGWRRLHPELTGEEVRFESWDGVVYRLLYIIRHCPNMQSIHHLFMRAMRIAVWQVGLVLSGGGTEVQRSEMVLFACVLRRLLVDELPDTTIFFGPPPMRLHACLGDSYAELHQIVLQLEPFVQYWIEKHFPRPRHEADVVMTAAAPVALA